MLWLVKSPQGEIRATNGPIFSKLGEAGIEEDELFGKGLPRDSLVPVTAIAGFAPDGLWATVIQTNGRTGWGELYRKRKSGWSRVGAALPHTHVHLGIGNWSGGRVLALQGTTMGMPPGPMFSFRIVAGPPAPLPVLTPAPARPESDPHEYCPHYGTLVVPEQLTVLPTGHVLVMGATCSRNGLAVERWEPGETKSSVHVFPGSSDWTGLRLLARSENDLALFANRKTDSLLARFNGTTWVTEPLDLDGALTDADWAPDGTLFAVSQRWQEDNRTHLPRRLWWRPAGQAQFSELPVPARPVPERWSNFFAGVTAVAASSKDDIWVFAGGALFHNRPSPSGPRKIDWAHDKQFAGNLRLPKAASASCNEVFVLLYGISKTTPPNYDFPLARKALAGRSEFQEVVLAETEDNGRRFFGAFVKDFAQGNRLSKLVRDTVPGSIPAVLCARPKKIREVAIDWKTGNLR